MFRPFPSHPWLVGHLVLGVLLTCCINRPETLANAEPTAGDRNSPPLGLFSGRPTFSQPVFAGDEIWDRAVGEATQAAQLAATAASAAEWNRVAQGWGRSAVLLKEVPAEDPRQAFSQRRAQEYLQNLAIAQHQARQQGMPRVFPALGSDVLDEQVSLYHSYVATLGAPDILIVGSSRALQGVDPQVLQQALAAQGYPGLRVYNFSVNGATAQVVSFLTRQLFAPDLHPKLIIWAEGSRAFNSGRFDRTFAEILKSPGYSAVRDGAQLSLATPLETRPDEEAPVPISAINSQGFLAVNDQFNPAVYYQSFPRVRGQYDDTYRTFRLEGVQTVSFEAMTQFLQARGIPLVFVNLPLSNDYLDSVRLGYERQFQTFLQKWANSGAMTVVDLLEIWRWQSHLFADPSHVNRYGAREIARLIASDSRIPWPQAATATPERSTSEAAAEL
ncbi:MAG TPA: hypothetical protein IGR64_10495 [Leptolyngbyaceae cyanobacterium M65_K2018_010]|nr:hypothetical protein [Leptolyngbyaceae cyanobacterium M65_K2018_010]